MAQVATDAVLKSGMVEVVEKINTAFARGNRLYIAGNGGSAADAQHMAAELVGYFGSKSDTPLPALALTTDTSFLTAWGNDDTFDNIFARQLQALGKPGDMLIVISTSGHSKNILNALSVARELQLYSVGLLGKNGGEAKELCDLPLVVQSNVTSHIQEAHIAIIHAICVCIDR
jgi:D-sedoheptulose 7-phosphate isomerase